VVASAGFEAAAVQVQRPRDVARSVTSGGFGEARASVSPTKSLPLRAVVVGDAFATSTANGGTGSSRHLGAVANPGFDVVGSAGSAKRETPGVVKAGGFASGVDAAPAARPAREQRPPAASLDTPVEIVSKPKPTYTDEARRLRLEGEVVLEVTFIASGGLRVLRILAGLGHGLDEAAVEAVQKIHFTPARRDGRPVDQTTTLRVVFRLA
jgi:TonB family protein